MITGLCDSGLTRRHSLTIEDIVMITVQNSKAVELILDGYGSFEFIIFNFSDQIPLCNLSKYL